MPRSSFFSGVTITQTTSAAPFVAMNIFIIAGKPYTWSRPKHAVDAWVMLQNKIFRHSCETSGNLRRPYSMFPNIIDKCIIIAVYILGLLSGIKSRLSINNMLSQCFLLYPLYYGFANSRLSFYQAIPPRHC